MRTQPNISATPGHTQTLLASLLHFDLSFMLWVLLGALGIYIAESAGLNNAQKGLVVAVPILSGAALRIPFGLLADRIGGKRVGLAMLAFLFLPLTVGWMAGDALPTLFAVGLMLGVAGASFAVALPLASRWYPPERQGLVMGIAAAGNSGTVIANLAAPRLADLMGWHQVLALAMVPLSLVFVAFLLLAKDSPHRAAKQPLSAHLGVLKHGDLWWFCLLYSVTFGGFVGLSSFLPIFLRDQYHVSKINAGYLTAIAAFAGSAARPLGGYLSDRLGGVRVLSVLLVVIGGVYLLASRTPGLGAMMGLLVVGMAGLGMGNGAVFQLVPQRFTREIGVATGVVGALGGLGGFLLPTLLGNVKQATGSFGPAFLVLGCVVLGGVIALGMLAMLKSDWRSSCRAARAAPLADEPER